MEITNNIKKVIIDRAEARIKFIDWSKFGVCPGEMYLAGGGLQLATPNDLDFFPADNSWKTDMPEPHGNYGEKIAQTKNAVTWKIDGRIIQFCKYFHPSLQALVESFDFSHCQVGVKIEIKKNEDGFIRSKVTDVYVSEKYIKYLFSGITEYTGSEYPTSSLVRLCKYIKQDKIQKHQYVKVVLGILTDIVQRGYHGYLDFKDQLDAVDLGLLPEDYKELSEKKDILVILYNKLNTVEEDEIKINE